MLILGFDTSAAHCAAALVSGTRVLAERHEDMARGQAERLFPLLEELLADAGASWQDLDGIGCGIGPGNFTGIRLSVSAARGLSLSLGIPAMGVTALEALVHGCSGPALASVDARRGHYYAQLFNSDAQTRPELVTKDDLVARFAGKVDFCFGHEAQDLATALGAESAAPKHGPGTAVAYIAAGRFDPDAPKPAPLYLKSADAKPSSEAAPVILT